MLSDLSDSLLQLEESLIILEECLQIDNSPFPNKSISSFHVERFKKFYSPRFNLEYSESGSYVYAALRVISVYYLEEPAIYQIPFSDRFKRSLEYLLDISLLSMAYRSNKHVVTEKLVILAEMWGLQEVADMENLLTTVLVRMRMELLNYNSLKTLANDNNST